MAEELTGSSVTPPTTPSSSWTATVSTQQRESPPESASSSGKSIKLLRPSQRQQEIETHNNTRLLNLDFTPPPLASSTPQKTDETTTNVLTQINSGASTPPQDIHSRPPSTENTTTSDRTFHAPPTTPRTIDISDRTSNLIATTNTPLASTSTTPQLISPSLNTNKPAKAHHHSKNPKISDQARINVTRLESRKALEASQVKPTEVHKALIPKAIFNSKEEVANILKPGTFICWTTGENNYLSYKPVKGGDTIHCDSADKSTLEVFKHIVLGNMTTSSVCIDLRDFAAIKNVKTADVENTLAQEQGNRWAVSIPPYANLSDPNRYDLVISIKEGRKAVQSYTLSKNPIKFHEQYIHCRSEGLQQFTPQRGSSATTSKTAPVKENDALKNKSQSSRKNIVLPMNSGQNLREAFEAHTPPTE